MRDVIIWWLAVQILSALLLPLAARLGRNLPDRGYSLSKAVGLLFPAYGFWLLSSFGLLNNDRSSIILVALVCGGLAWMLLPSFRGTLVNYWRRDRRTVVLVELLFAGALFFWALARAFEPQIAATEKPMEFAFLNGVLRSERFPPVDPWLSGHSISYYYFGYVIMGMLAKLTGIASSVSFNLSIALLFALTVTGAFGVAYNLARAARGDGSLAEGKGKQSSGPVLCGLLGALFTAVMGNLEGFLEILHSRAWLPLSFWNWVGVQGLDKPYVSEHWYPSDFMWWFRASRVIADFDPVSRVARDYTINEFPFFSFLLADLHPHVMALPFTILALALALNLLLSRTAPDLKEWRKNPWEFMGLSLVVGALGFLNSWDMPTYALVLVGAFALRKLLEPGSLLPSPCGAGATPESGRAAFWRIGKESTVFLALLLVSAVVMYLPFYLGFSSQASGIGPVLVRSKMHQWLLFWGPFIVLSGSFVLAQLSLRLSPAPAAVSLEPVGQKGTLAAFSATSGVADVFGALQLWVTALLLAFLAGGIRALRRVGASGGERWSHRQAVTVFVLCMILFATSLLLATEVVFIRDFFGNRMNTVFKVYYQAWVLMAIASAYVVYYFASRLRARLKRERGTGEDKPAHRNFLALGDRAGFAVAVVLLVMAFAYPVAAIHSRASGFRGDLSLDGVAHLGRFQRDDYEAINWLQRNVSGTPIILEAPGNSYSDFGRVSASTGLPTVLGWDGHELQWRGSGDEPARRKTDVDNIYRAGDSRAALDLLKKYGVTYVYVGSLERQKYGVDSPAWLNKFSDIGDIVYQNPGVAIFKIRAGKRG